MNHPAIASRAEAVLFFEHGALRKEMLRVEFDALLDHVVGVADFAGQTINAAYATILPGLVVEAVVLFRIGFDDEGYADRNWNLPLEQLLHYVESVSTLGQTDLRITCRSHCPLPWYQADLWDPDLDRDHNELTQIQEAIARNRLGLTFSTSPESSQPLSAISSPQQAVSHHDSNLAAQPPGQQHQLFELRKAHQKELTELTEELDRYAKSLEDELSNNLALKQKLHDQQIEIKKLSLLSGSTADAQQELDQLRAEIEAGAATKLTDLEEAFKLQEVELCYAREHRVRLEARLARLQQERSDWAGQSAGGLLTQLHDLGVAFIAYHLGAGHFNLPIARIPDYLANPLSHAAERCQVSEAHYQLWLDHYQQPRCSAVQSGGGRCEQIVTPIQAPANFVAGESDRCPHHRHHDARMQG